MPLGRLWAGSVYGTNTGNLFVELNGDDTALSGTLRFNEPGVGIVIYSIRGSFDGSVLTLNGDPQTQTEGILLGALHARAVLGRRNELSGEWSTTIGSAGTFILYSHDPVQTETADANSLNAPDQLHTAWFTFKAVIIDRDQITKIADEIQREFKSSSVGVTVTCETAKSYYLPKFKTQTFEAEQAIAVRLFAREPEGTGVDRIVEVEFGPQLNKVMTQGGDESWVLGMCEKIKRLIHPYERAYATSFMKLGFGINQIFIGGAIVYLPSLASVSERAIFMIAVILLTYSVDQMHRRYLPFAAIYLRTKPIGAFTMMKPTFLSWIIAFSAGVLGILAAAYLQNNMTSLF